MKCAGCNKEAKYMVHQSLQAHCEECFQYAIEDCAVPTIVMTVEGYQKYMSIREALRSVG